MSKLIYVADDEANICELICSFLKNSGFEAVSFSTGDDLLAAFQKTPADMIILDITMPGKNDGLAVCKQIRQTNNVPIIMVSAKDSELDRITGITVGSDDYLSKPFSPSELVARVQAIFRRIDLDKGNLEPSFLNFGDIHLDVLGKKATLKNKPLELTPTEFTLMIYFIKHQDRAVSREELLKNVWKFDFEVDTRATDDVVKRLRKKLAGSDVKINAVWGFGFQLEKINVNYT